MWIANIGKNLTFDNLRNRLLLMVDWCSMCKRSGELINHLWLHCSLTTIMWNLWSKRNMRTLDDGEQSNFVIKVSFEAPV